MRIQSSLIGLLLGTCFAISADEAGIIDYHLQLFGLPSNRSTFFHPPVAGSKASLLYTLSEESVLGAVKPKDGSVVWRQRLQANATDAPGQLVAGDGQDTLVTAVGDTVTEWSAADGRFEWEVKFSEQRVSSLKRIEISEGKGKSARGDIVAVVEGKHTAVQRLDASTGAVLWSYEDNSGDASVSLSASGNSLYYISAHKALLKGVKLKVTTLDHDTGKSIDQITLASDSDLSSPSDVLAVGATPTRPILVWTDASRQTLKANVLGTKNISSSDIKSAPTQVDKVSVVSSPQGDAEPHFLVHYQSSDSHWAQVFHVDAKKGSVSKAYDLPKLGGHGAFSASAINANLYFTRTTNDELSLVSSASHGIIGKWPIKGGLGSSNQVKGSSPDVFPVHSASEVVSRTSGSFAVRSAVLLSTGKWVLIQNGDISWTRPEMLAGIKRAEWLESTQADTLAEELEAESHANIVSASLHRLKRHIHQVQNLPDLVTNFGEIASNWAEALVGRQSQALAQAKTFGFDRRVVAETDRGDIVVLNPSLSDKVELQLKVNPTHASLSLNEQLKRQRDQATTADNPEEIQGKSTLQPASYGIVDGALQGLHGRSSIWRYMLVKDKTIVSITRPVSGERVASIGKVLGDRTVLYKYLNPNAILVMATDQKRKELDVTLLDSASGSVLYSTTHHGVDMNRYMTSVVSEHWIAYSFTMDAAREGQSRGHQLVIAELYESELPNDRGPLGAVSNFSSLTPPVTAAGPIKPHVYTQSFFVPEEITKMIVTQTEQGITSRELIVTLAESNGIVAIPRHALDPRRPVDKDPNSQQLEEGLMRYYPLIDFDPKWYITHKNEVAGIENIIITPSAMESTSLIFAYGLDIYSTRVNPSFPFDILGDSFNKHSLILTVVALTAACFAVAPFIQKKQTNTLWHT